MVGLDSTQPWQVSSCGDPYQVKSYLKPSCQYLPISQIKLSNQPTYLICHTRVDQPLIKQQKEELIFSVSRQPTPLTNIYLIRN
ncbi:MAG: hypothetical protein GF381_01530 [Candidatus Pacebacteria bacterium]|nr:hypothetical protein [Candidatus Paceibacterota bacterium]